MEGGRERGRWREGEKGRWKEGERKMEGRREGEIIRFKNRGNLESEKK